MNDLAEKALDGLARAHREVRARPMRFLAGAGFVTGVVVVVAGGRVGAAGSTRPLTTWLGLQPAAIAPDPDAGTALVLVASIAVLVLLWLALVRFVHRHPQPSRRLWWLAGAWATPFAVGPPLLSTGIYSYVAHGLLERAGRNPYRSPPSRLADTSVIAAIDPGARDRVSGDGPLATLIEHVAVSVGRGNALAALIVLRVLGVLVAVVIVRLCSDTADAAGRRPDRVLALAAANPLLVLYVVSGARLDGLLVALVLGALQAARRRSWPAAAALAALAGSVCPPGFVVVPVVIAWHSARRRADGRSGPAVLLGAARDLAVAAAVTAAVGVGVRGGFGWVTTITKQFADTTPFSPVGAVSGVLAPVVRGASYDDLLVGGRVTTVTAMVCAVGYLLWTAGRRPLPDTAGYSLLAVGLLAPVLHPWYLLWGVLVLAPVATDVILTWVVAISAAGCVLAPPGLSDRLTDTVVAVQLALVGLAVAVVLHRQLAVGEPIDAANPADPDAVVPDPVVQRPPDTSRTAGRTSAR